MKDKKKEKVVKKSQAKVKQVTELLDPAVEAGGIGSLRLMFEEHSTEANKRMDGLLTQLHWVERTVDEEKLSNKNWQIQLEKQGKLERKAFVADQDLKHKEAEKRQVESTDLLMSALGKLHNGLNERFDFLAAKSVQMSGDRGDEEAP